jgi:hypothetical protein
LLASDLQNRAVREYLRSIGIEQPKQLEDGRLLNADEQRLEDLIAFVRPHRHQVFVKMPVVPLRSRPDDESSGRLGITYAEMWLLSRELGREVAPFRAPGFESQQSFWTSAERNDFRGRPTRLNFDRADASAKDWYLSIGPADTLVLPSGLLMQSVTVPSDSYSPFHTHPRGSPPSLVDVRNQKLATRLNPKTLVISGHPDVHLDELWPHLYGRDDANGFVGKVPFRLFDPSTWLNREVVPADRPTVLMQASPGNVVSVTEVPVLDADGPGYLLMLQSLPGLPPRMALRPAHRATIDGKPAPGQAATRRSPHGAMHTDFFPGTSRQWREDAPHFIDEDGVRHRVGDSLAGAYFEYRADGSIDLTTKSNRHNGWVVRVGNVRVEPKLRPGQWPDELLLLDHQDGAAARELARLVSQATGRPVRLADPGLPARCSWAKRRHGATLR